MLESLKEVKGLGQCAKVPKRARSTAVWAGFGTLVEVLGFAIDSKFLKYAGAVPLLYGGYKGVRTTQAYEKCHGSVQKIKGSIKKTVRT